MIVLDASAAIEIALQSDEGTLLLAGMVEGEPIVSVDLFRAEVASAFRKFKRAKSLSYEEAHACMQDTIALVRGFYPMEDLLEEAFAESIRLDHSLYDMLYFVLARRLGATLFSCDSRLLELCAAHGVDCIEFYNL